MGDLDIVRCCICGGKVKHQAEHLQCQSCGQIYPIVGDVPIMLREPELHEEDLEAARNSSPIWYQQEQPAEENSPWRHHMKKRRLYVQQQILRYLASQNKDKVSRLLALGCGDGHHMTWLKQYADQVYGCDYNLLRLVRAKQLMGEDADIFLADILDFPVDDESVDLIFFNHVIEHIVEDVQALKIVARVLAPDGILILGTPNEGAWWWQWAYKRDPESMRTTDHKHFYTATLLVERMKEAGFQIMQVKHMGWGPPDWHLDGKIRKYKIIDDLFELFGKILIPKQASSLYVIAKSS